MSDKTRFITWIDEVRGRIVRCFGYRGVSASVSVPEMEGDFIFTAQNPEQLAKVWKRLGMEKPLDPAKVVQTITVEAVDRNPAVVRLE